MAKPQKAAVPIKQKSAKDLKKELEAKLFGEKNKTKKKEIQTMIKKLDLEMELEKKSKQAKEDAKKVEVKQLIPVGVDPKTVPCINHQNKICSLGDKCQFAHDIIRKEVKRHEIESEEPKVKLVCRFLIDALNSGEYMPSWTCPNPSCRDIHKLIELGSNKDAEVSLEEYIELQRQTMTNIKLTPVTEESFGIWKEKKLKEEEKHALRVAALSLNAKGIDLFKSRPEIFDDDEEAVDGDDIDYHHRSYEYSEESEVENSSI